MKEPKFKVGQIVFLMMANKPVKSIVTAISYGFDRYGNEYCKYKIKDYDWELDGECLFALASGLRYYFNEQLNELLND